MISKEHSRHSALIKPATGKWGRNEWAILGTTCGKIKQITDAVFSQLGDTLKCLYVDSKHYDHSIDGGGQSTPHKDKYATYLKNSPSCHIMLPEELGQQHLQTFTAQYDLILVNGNHEQANEQIVVIDAEKKESLRRRLPELTHIKMFILSVPDIEVFDFIKEKFPNWGEIPTFHCSQYAEITQLLLHQLHSKIPKINGLVLAGGKSTRMGFDKTAINWHGKEQKYFLYDLLKGLCAENYISCTTDQLSGIEIGYDTLQDTFTGLGPFGAILSAFRQDPNAAWLVLASDMPLADADLLQFLVSNRKAAACATTFLSPYDGLPEPLITIWEPKSYPLLLAALAAGVRCPRKVLLKNNTHMLAAPDPSRLANVNTPQDAEQISGIINKNKLL
jgi:molybdenum cofactor guanylyltransferase